METVRKIVPGLTPSPVAWNDPNVSPAVEHEEDKIQQLCSLANRIQERNRAHHHHGFRTTHVKTQAIVKGTLTIAADLAPELAQGIFANAGKIHPIVIRYANEPIFWQDDRKPGPRGCGMKVFDVDGPGAFLSGAGEAAHTQDFTFNNAPMLELRDLDTTLEIFTLREKFFDDPNALHAAIQQREDRDVQLAPADLPNQHFLSYTMYSQSAYRFGPYVAKHALVPTGTFQAALAEHASITDASDPLQHRLWLQEYFAAHDAEFEFRVQLCRDLAQQSVEDTSREWSEAEFPFVTVGKVVLPRQEALGEARQAFYDDRMKLNVWDGLEAHTPLGSVNRLRRTLYQASVRKREEMNGVVVENVKSIGEIP
nr:uncharacterized protein y4il [Quercus suber]